MLIDFSDFANPIYYIYIYAHRCKRWNYFDVYEVYGSVCANVISVFVLKVWVCHIICCCCCCYYYFALIFCFIIFQFYSLFALIYWLLPTFLIVKFRGKSKKRKLPFDHLLVWAFKSVVALKRIGKVTSCAHVHKNLLMSMTMTMMMTRTTPIAIENMSSKQTKFYEIAKFSKREWDAFRATQSALMNFAQHFLIWNLN